MPAGIDYIMRYHVDGPQTEAWRLVVTGANMFDSVGAGPQIRTNASYLGVKEMSP